MVILELSILLTKLQTIIPIERSLVTQKLGEKSVSVLYLLAKSFGHVASHIFFMAVSTTGSVTESQDTEGMRPTQPAPVIYLNCSENVFKLRIYYYI